MRTVARCPVCNNDRLSTSMLIKDHAVSHETFQILQCDQCELLITNPQPDDSELPRYYESKDYLSHTDKARTPLERVYQQARAYNLNWKYKLINKIKGAGPWSLLDFGCGAGDFMKYCHDKGHRVYGVEPSAKAREIAERKTGQHIARTLDDHDDNINVVTAWHVIEHVPAPGQTLGRIHALLEPEGHAIIAVPNHRSYDGQHYKEIWAGYDTPRHLWHFSQSNMKMLLERTGFEPTEVLPMKLDSFYVALLSEKYKHGKLSPPAIARAVIQGLRSNIRASTTGEYSSLVYIARRK